MENENQITGIQTGLDEVLQQHEQARAASQADSVFVKVQNHESVKLGLTGKTYVRQASGSKAEQAWTATKVDFELRATNPEGKHKLWSIGISNPIVQEIIPLIKKGVLDIQVHREGEGTNTKYSIVKERAV